MCSACCSVVCLSAPTLYLSARAGFPPPLRPLVIVPSFVEFVGVVGVRATACLCLAPLWQLPPHPVNLVASSRGAPPLGPCRSGLALLFSDAVRSVAVHSLPPSCPCARLAPHSRTFPHSGLCSVISSELLVASSTESYCAPRHHSPIYIPYIRSISSLFNNHISHNINIIDTDRSLRSPSEPGEISTAARSARTVPGAPPNRHLRRKTGSHATTLPGAPSPRRSRGRGYAHRGRDCVLRRPTARIRPYMC